ncbi:MAG: cellulase family glycosylhydrolase [Lachnospiraceae bacterium]|nr:cellulase family glycosylhydrolase [Candidatus Merdinaster equi]
MTKWEGYQKGINFGGWLSQCNHTKERYDNFIKEEDFKTVSEWGADHVRIPVDYNLVETKEGAYKEDGFAYIQNAINWCEKYNLNMILDLHKTMGFSFDVGEQEDGFFNNESYQERFYLLWEQFAKRFGKYYKRVAFELLNEVTSPDYMPTWLSIVEIAIKRIRAIEPNVTIMVGGYYNNSVEAVKDIKLSTYDNIILNFHCYDPIVFTHQGAHWVPEMDTEYRTVFPKNAGDYAKEMAHIPFCQNLMSEFEEMGRREPLITSAYFEMLFESAIKTAEEIGVPLYCGEYGVIDRADTTSILNWYKMIMEVLKKHDIGRAAWSYREMDFGFVDEHMKPIIEDIKKELFA